ncbi:MAG TPA: hypothetical protein VFC10_17135 [Terriglobia bacterium]|jgi:hypothetical protein|nr:hypothetical protein [Terriglobia bacterium]
MRSLPQVVFKISRRSAAICDLSANLGNPANVYAAAKTSAEFAEGVYVVPASGKTKMLTRQQGI